MVAVRDEGERAWDRGGGHREEVWFAVAEECVALFYSKFVLLVDDDESEVVKIYFFAEECVGADDYFCFTAGESRRDFVFLFHFHAADEKIDAKVEVEVLDCFEKVFVMLASECLGGAEKCGLAD